MKWTKPIALLLAILCLLSGCTQGPDLSETGEVSPSQPQNDPLSSKKLEIENAWLQVNGRELGAWYSEEDGKAIDGIRYYGSYDGLDILFESGQLTAVTSQKIGDATFSHSSSFRLLAYQNGTFYDLKDAYEDGKVSDETLELLASLHLQYEQRLYPIFSQPPMDGDVLEQMKQAFLKQYVEEGMGTTKDLTVIYYGEYDGAHVGFINGILHYTQAFNSEKIGNFTFQYTTGQKLLVYYDGALMGLRQAYEEGILSDEAVGALYRNFAKLPEGEKE